MFRTRLVIPMLAGLACVALPAFSQTEEGRQEVSAQVYGNFVKETTQDGINNKATKTAGVLGTYRFFFSKHHGVEANYGWNPGRQNYTWPNNGVTGVKGWAHEVSGAYVLRMPLSKFTPFALAGAGALIFQPRNYAYADTQARAAFVYGGGADFNVTHHLFLRAEYRGFVYNSPTYKLSAFSNLDRVTHRAEPSVGFGYRF